MKKFGIRSLLATVAMLGCAQPALAQEEIDVEPYDAYAIPDTGLSFPATLAGSVREKVVRFGEGDYNIGSTYYRRDNDDIVSVYYYRLVAGSVPLWFDRVATLLEANNPLGEMSDYLDFDLSDSGAGAAMVRVWSMEGEFRSSAFLLAQRDDMLVKLRVSSKELPPEAMADFVREIMAELAIPFERTDAYVPISECTTAFQPFAKKVARVSDDKDDGLAEGLMAAVLGSAARIKSDEDEVDVEEVDAPPPVPFCREDVANGIYRRVGTQDSYLIALQDSGVSVSVGPATSLVGILNEKSDAMAYRATIHQTTKDVIFPELDGFPSPQDAIDFLQSTRPLSVVKTAGESKGNVEINM